MRTWLRPPVRRHDDITISAIRVAFVLSLLVHAVLLWNYLPKLHLLTPSDAAEGQAGSPLAVKLADPQPQAGAMPLPVPPPESTVALQQPARKVPPPVPSKRPPSTPPVMSVPRQSPDAAIARTQPEPAPTPQPAPAQDLASLVEARRRARGESSSSASSSASDSKTSEEERQNKIIAANLGLNARPSFGRDASNGGGVFQMRTQEYDYAEFWFFGWNKDIARNAKQVIEVRKGDNPNIRIAVVRRMIAIIREHESGDFIWESYRLGQHLTLSARPSDTAALEAFLMREFFFEQQVN
jgi:outer membrane biosynthesis protein TonB